MSFIEEFEGKVYKSRCLLTIAMKLLSVEKDQGDFCYFVMSSQVFQSPDKSVYERGCHQ
jgi:hypothetical protein